MIKTLVLVEKMGKFCVRILLAGGGLHLAYTPDNGDDWAQARSENRLDVLAQTNPAL